MQHAFAAAGRLAGVGVARSGLDDSIGTWGAEVQRTTSSTVNHGTPPETFGMGLNCVTANERLNISHEATGPAWQYEHTGVLQ